MQEILPLTLGLLIGVLAMHLREAGWRMALIPVACLFGGLAASAINGELDESGWFFFVSIDSLLVWAGAAIGSAASAGARRIRTS
jgi:hypothetical protein